MELMTRAEAKARGLSRYFTGKACPHGHVAERMASNCVCVVCQKSKTAEYRKTEKGKKRTAERVERWYVENTERRAETNKRWYAENTERRTEAAKRWYAENTEQQAANNKRWRINNPGAYNAIAARYRAALLKATPPWANKELINKIYKECPPGHHVDHIVPLQGKHGGEHVVRGYHVEHNLQYLTGPENCAKCNKWNPMEDSKQFD